MHWKTVLQGTPILLKNERKVVLWMKEILDQELTSVNQVLKEVINYCISTSAATIYQYGDI